MPDSALVEGFPRERTGPLSHSEFAQLYEANAGAILGYVLASTGRRDVAEDVVQETFCRVLSEKQAARVAAMDANELRRYLFRVAGNLLRDRWRSRDEMPAPGGEEEIRVEAGLAEDLDTSLDVRAMLAQLKPRQRELLWLAYVECMDHAEIAAATGLSRLSVRLLLFRARKEAKSRLDVALLRAPGRPR